MLNAHALTDIENVKVNRVMAVLADLGHLGGAELDSANPRASALRKELAQWVVARRSTSVLTPRAMLDAKYDTEIPNELARVVLEPLPQIHRQLVQRLLAMMVETGRINGLDLEVSNPEAKSTAMALSTWLKSSDLNTNTLRLPKRVN